MVEKLIENTERKPNFYAIIPANVRYDKELSSLAKLLFGEITALTGKDGFCWATNEYFANLFNVTARTITRTIQILREKGFIDYEIIRESSTKKIIKRCIYPVDKNVYTYRQKCLYPIDKNVQENNTSIINLNITNKRNIKEKPKLEEIEAYVKEKNLNVDSLKFFNYFDANDWHDANGKSVRSWKQKLITWDSYSKPKTVEAVPEYKDTNNPAIDMSIFEEMMRTRNET